MKIINYFLVILLFSTFVQAGNYSKKEEKVFQFPLNGQVLVENSNGFIEIESWDRNEVWLEVTKKVRAHDQEEANEYFEEIEIQIDYKNDRLEIHTKYPHRHPGGFFDWLFEGGSWNTSVEYRLKVPKATNLDMETTNGHVEIHEVEGDLKARTTNGGLTLENVTGAIEAVTTNGGITLKVNSAEKLKEVNVRTTNGSIKFYCSKDVDADFNAQTTNGSIESDFAITVKGKIDRHHLSGKINKGGKYLSLKTTNGSIKLYEW